MNGWKRLSCPCLQGWPGDLQGCRFGGKLSALSFSVTVWGWSAGPRRGRVMPDVSHYLFLSIFPLYIHKYIGTPSNINSLCSLWQAQAVCFCGLTSPLYLSVITLELSDPKTKREPAMCASTVGWRSVSTATHSLFDLLLWFHLFPALIFFNLMWNIPGYIQHVSSCVCTLDSNSFCISS